MRIFYDTEFLDRGPHHPIDLISVGMVREDGSTLYAVSNEFDQRAVSAHPWLKLHVWPHLPLAGPRPGMRGPTRPRLDTTHPDVHPRAQIARMVARFVLGTPHPELWADHPAHDHVVLTQLFGAMVDLPAGFPMRTKDLRQRMDHHGVERLPPRSGDHTPHHALSDALQLRNNMLWIDQQRQEGR